MTVLAGVDAGGSHCEAAVSGPDLEPTARRSGGRAIIREGATGAAALAIAAALEEALDAAGMGRPVDALVVGAAGAGNPAARSALHGEMVATALAKRVAVTTDGHIALEAAFPTGAGIVLIAGTGSVAFARDLAGTVARAGGHGWEGGDAGSAFAIGQSALEAATGATDDGSESSALAHQLARAAGCRDPFALDRWSRGADPQAVAALAQDVLELAEAGNEVARDIVHAAAEDLCLLVLALTPHLAGVDGVRLALSGGLLRPASPLRGRLTRIVSERISAATIVADPVDPVVGALRLAAALA